MRTIGNGESRFRAAACWPATAPVPAGVVVVVSGGTRSPVGAGFEPVGAGDGDGCGTGEGEGEGVGAGGGGAGLVTASDWLEIELSRPLWSDTCSHTSSRLPRSSPVTAY